MKLHHLVLMAAVLATPVAALGHGASPNGGQLVDAPPFHLELVAQGQDVILYVTDAKMSPVDVDGARATATILMDGKPERVELTPAGKDKLAGQSSSEIGKGAKIVTSLTMPGHKPVQARFEVGL